MWRLTENPHERRLHFKKTKNWNKRRKKQKIPTTWRLAKTSSNPLLAVLVGRVLLRDTTPEMYTAGTFFIHWTYTGSHLSSTPPQKWHSRAKKCSWQWGYRPMYIESFPTTWYSNLVANIIILQMWRPIEHPRERRFNEKRLKEKLPKTRRLALDLFPTTWS